MINPVIQIFINIWYWFRPPCIRLLWLWTFYYMWILVLYFQYPLFFRLWIFSPDCRRGIFHCSFILTSDSMCINFFTSFTCKKMHSGRLCFFWCTYFPGFLQNTYNSFLWYSAGLTITNTMRTRAIKINKFVESRSTVTDCIYWKCFILLLLSLLSYLKKATKLLSLWNVFRQKLLSSSVNYCTKRWKLNYIESRTMLIKMNSDNKKRGKAWKCEN